PARCGRRARRRRSLRSSTVRARASAKGAPMTLDAAVRRAFEEVLDPRDVISDEVRRRSYECDGLTGYRVVPGLVLLPRDAAQVAAAVRVCAAHGVPFVARGAGTGLSGGA